MDTFASFWTNVNDAQATIVSSGFTVLAAVIGVLLGGVLFGNRVRDLRSAVEETEKAAHSAQSFISELASKVDALSSQLSKLQSTALATDAKLSRQFVSQSTDEEALINDESDANTPVEAEDIEFDTPAGQRLKAAWKNIATELDLQMTSPEVDGRTRRRYLNIPRHNWTKLVGVLEREGVLKSDAAAFVEAARLWESNKRNLAQVSNEDAQRMEDLANKQVPK